jgi:hypothetical protein
MNPPHLTKRKINDRNLDRNCGGNAQRDRLPRGHALSMAHCDHCGRYDKRTGRKVSEHGPTRSGFAPGEAQRRSRTWEQLNVRAALEGVRRDHTL